ncbi:MAG: type II secretion system minor pseudopilin GspK [Psychromonas sp.]|nr:type II secretion system minor pseudopilin GspK [Psychromonas sp.]
MRHLPRKQKGVALLTVLLILSVMITIAVSMTSRLTRGIKLTEGIVFSQSAYWYGQAAADLGVMVLNQDFKETNTVSLNQTWARPNFAFPLQNGSISGTVKDMRSCFNVNALGKTDKGNNQIMELSEFQLLLTEIGIARRTAKIIAHSTKDWIDINNVANDPQGAEDAYYKGLGLPYLAAHHLMVDISELRAVRGVGQKTYDAIAPFLCAIPVSDQKIDINTVSAKQPEILYALLGENSGIRLGALKQLLASRPKNGWKTVNQFLSDPLLGEFKPSDGLINKLSVTSDFFQLNGIIKFQEHILAVKLLFNINKNKAKFIRYQSGGIM